jgi:hypothetical protein
VSKVYCVTEPITYRDGNPVPLFDITPAIEYGEIEILTRHNQSMQFSVPMIRSLRDKLKDFNDNDFILPVGDPITIGAVCAVVADINGGYYKVLKWDKRTRKYLPIEIQVWGSQLS